jgi:S1-C subfamily serine protease
MGIGIKGWGALLLAVVLMVAPVPAVAETAGTAAGIPAVAARARASVVGILNTMQADRSTEKGRAAGTGFVYKEGVIITNAHVVENAAEVQILYPDKTVETVAPSQILADPISDVAVIKVKKAGLEPLPFANSDEVVVGQQVVAVGNPLGFRLGNSVSAGILSGVGRSIGSGYPFLQVDAPINPGNSGGPLLNLQGEVIGINSAKMVEFGVEGLGFAIPANTAREIAEMLLRDGKVIRATLGITLDEGWEAYFGVPDLEGVTIGSIITDGPVGKTALRSGDKLVKLDETPIFTSDDVHAFLARKKPGDVVRITVRRGGQLLTATVTLASYDELRQVAEAEGAKEATGILMNLTAGQIQEAAEFGRTLASGFAHVSDDYFAMSGSHQAFLYTEFLYVARRVSSAYEFGFKPSVAFQQAVAEDIRGQVEVQMELHGEQAGFLQGAVYTLEQSGKQVKGSLVSPVTYTTSTDGKVALASLSVRFHTAGLTPTEDLAVTVQQSDGKVITFHFRIKDLR